MPRSDKGKRAELIEREGVIVDYKKQGLSFVEIGTILGLSHTQVSRDYNRYLERMGKRNERKGKRLFADLTLKLESLLEDQYKIAMTTHDDKAVSRVKELADQLLKMYGQYPTVGTGTGTVNNTYVLNWGNSTPAHPPALPDGNTVDSAPIEVTRDSRVNEDSA